MLRHDFREILASEMISVTGGLFAGFLLSFITNKLEMIPALLILLPGFLEMRGNISGSLSARLSSGLFVGAFRKEYNKETIVRGNVAAALILVIVLSIFMGCAAYYLSAEFFGIVNPNIIFVALIAGVLSALIEIPITIVLTFWLFKRGHDPNNIMGPYVTATADILSILSLLIGLMLI